MPRFSLPGESDAHGFDPRAGGHSAQAWTDGVDDAAATSQRPAVTVRPGSRRVAKQKPAADATSEVQVEDILLEVYAEEPPPPLSRRAPPPPSQSAAVDALLRASDPAFAPYVAPHHSTLASSAGYASHVQHVQHVQHGQPHSYGSIPAMAIQHDARAEYDTPSLSPVMLTTAAPPARPVLPAKRTNRALVAAIWSIVLLVVGVAAGAAVVMGVRNGTYARVRDGAKAVAARAGSKHSAPVSASPAAPAMTAAVTAPPAALAPPSQVVVAPAPPAPSAVAVAVAAPASVPTMSVDALPRSPIPADMSLVTLPAYAQGHRVFVDGRVIAVADGTPTKIKCGRHMVKIGSARKPRVLDLACGREVIVQ